MDEQTAKKKWPTVMEMPRCNCDHDKPLGTVPQMMVTDDPGKGRVAIRCPQCGVITPPNTFPAIIDDWEMYRQKRPMSQTWEKLLPAWMSRAIDDVWGFVFMLRNGQRVAFSTISNAEKDPNGDIWVEVSTDGGMDLNCPNKRYQGLMQPGNPQRDYGWFRLDEIVGFWELYDS